MRATAYRDKCCDCKDELEALKAMSEAEPKKRMTVAQVEWLGVMGAIGVGVAIIANIILFAVAYAGDTPHHMALWGLLADGPLLFPITIFLRETWRIAGERE